MNRQVMITTLFSGDNVSKKAYYYYVDEGGRTFYCDALMPAEAACKCMLARYPIDEIVIIGSEALNIPDDESRPVVLREGQSFYASDLEALSRYDLLRYRLAEYVDELRIEAQDNIAMLSGDERDKAIACLRRFFGARLNAHDNRPNRYFHLLAQDRGLFEALQRELREWVPESEYDRYMAWVSHHLFQELNGTCRMEPAEANGDVRIRFIPVKEGDSLPFLKRMRAVFDRLEASGKNEGVDIFLCLQNSEAGVVLDIFNLINLTKLIPDIQVRVCNTVTITCRPDTFADEITDRTGSQNLSELLSGAAAFLDYGKTDAIIRYWKRSGARNPRIEQIIYAMRNIDNGISLCDIGDIERGIRRLRILLADETPIEGNAPVERFFDILQEAIRRDYGRMLETEQVEFIDLVRWAYRKRFWQQTLTLVESRAPGDFIERGFFYYCDSEEHREDVTKRLGQLYYDLRPFEKYRMKDISHYFVKIYNREKANRQKHGREYNRDYARLRVSELEPRDPGVIRACTCCPDRTALEDLLFAYYCVGDVRNVTNHAGNSFDSASEIKGDADSSDRMETIRQSIEYFLCCYDKVARLSEGRPANVVQVSFEDMAKCADELREQNRNRGR